MSDVLTEPNLECFICTHIEMIHSTLCRELIGPFVSIILKNKMDNNTNLSNIKCILKCHPLGRKQYICLQLPRIHWLQFVIIFHGMHRFPLRLHWIHGNKWDIKGKLCIMSIVMCIVELLLTQFTDSIARFISMQ